MDLREYFQIGLSVDAYEGLLEDDQRSLHRLYARRAQVDADAVAALRSSPIQRALVITEPWCGDSLAIFPVVARLFVEAGCDLRIVRRDEHPDLIDRYLTNRGRAIPILIAMDASFREEFHWGPRPRPAQDLVLKHKEDVAAGRVEKADVHKRVRAFYARDCGRTIVSELLERMRELRDDARMLAEDSQN